MLQKPLGSYTEQIDEPDKNMKNKRSLLPYGDSTLSPPISSTDKEVAEWKSYQSQDSNKFFSTKYKEIVKEMEKLKDSFDENERINKAELRFTPIVGKDYYLYERSDKSMFISMISPNEWKQTKFQFLGCYRIDSQNVWTHGEYNA